MTAPILLFWTCVFLIAYGYAGYPALLRAWGALRPARPAGGRRREPTVVIVLVVHDEEAHIEGRIKNLLALDYPRDRLEIVIGSDGSTDETVARARVFEGAGVRITAFRTRRGKAAVISELVPRCRSEIVVLADARQRFEAGTLRALVGPFADPRVGAVSGQLILTSGPETTPATRGIGLYWRIESAIRLGESRIDSTIGATGAIYAIRRELFDPIPDDTILDDVLIPMRIVGRGYRVIFEPAARAYDRAGSARQEFVRKVRTIAGNFQLFTRERWLLDPFRNRLWLQTVSHKLLRLFGPLLFATVLTATVVLSDRPFFLWALLAQAVFYASALCGGVNEAARRIPLITVPYTVCLLQWATVVAFVRFLTGRQRVAWERAAN